MKPIDKTDHIMQEEFAKLDKLADVDQQYRRDEKRVWKKARTKHIRNSFKEDLRQQWIDYENQF